jgi:excisionase family DNA binding protein
MFTNVPHSPAHARVPLFEYRDVSLKRGSIKSMQNQTHAATLPPHPSIKQAAEYHGVDQKTIRRWIAQGRLMAQRVGPRPIRLDREEVLSLGRRIGGAA